MSGASYVCAVEFVRQECPRRWNTNATSIDIVDVDVVFGVIYVSTLAHSRPITHTNTHTQKMTHANKYVTPEQTHTHTRTERRFDAD